MINLLIGLGNPTKKHEKDRHNVGFMVIDAIKAKLGTTDSKTKFNAEITHTEISDKPCLLVKPLSYMNKSGVPVSEIKNFYKIPISKIMVFYDELDLAVGKVRVKTGGGNAGHNGLKSLDAHIGKSYTRVRIGIDHPGVKEKVASHVLSPFFSGEQQVIHRVIESISDHVPLLIKFEHDKFMSKVAEDTIGKEE